jgi:hypothetical protein
MGRALTVDDDPDFDQRVFEAVVDEFTALLKSYRVMKVSGDKYVRISVGPLLHR